MDQDGGRRSKAEVSQMRDSVFELISAGKGAEAIDLMRKIFPNVRTLQSQVSVLKKEYALNTRVDVKYTRALKKLIDKYPNPQLEAKLNDPETRNATILNLGGRFEKRVNHEGFNREFIAKLKDLPPAWPMLRDFKMMDEENDAVNRVNNEKRDFKLNQGGIFHLSTRSQDVYNTFMSLLTKDAGWNTVFALLVMSGRRSSDIVAAIFQPVPNEPNSANISNFVKDRTVLKTPYNFPLLCSFNRFKIALERARSFLKAGNFISMEKGHASIKPGPANRFLQKTFEAVPPLRESVGENMKLTVHSLRSLYVTLLCNASNYDSYPQTVLEMAKKSINDTAAVQTYMYASTSGIRLDFSE